MTLTQRLESLKKLHQTAGNDYTVRELGICIKRLKENKKARSKKK